MLFKAVAIVWLAAWVANLVLYDVYVSTIWRDPGRLVRCIFYPLNVARFKTYSRFFVRCISKYRQHDLLPISDYTGFPAVVFLLSIISVG